MNCSECKCICPDACGILKECVLGHELVKDHAVNFKEMVLEVDERRRLKRVRKILEALKPYKVSQYQIDRHWGLMMYEGIDLDNPEKSNIEPKELKRHLKKQLSYKNSYIKSTNKEILNRLMYKDGVDFVISYKPIKKVKTLQYVYKEKVHKPKAKKLKQIVKELGFHDNPVIMERNLYLQMQSPEQFELAKKFGWEFAKYITQPQTENFHLINE